EDGIRDRNVTGVQTCALPILYRDSDEYIGFQTNISGFATPGINRFSSFVSKSEGFVLFVHIIMILHFLCCLLVLLAVFEWNSNRSEERRVGRECGRRWLYGVG